MPGLVQGIDKCTAVAWCRGREMGLVPAGDSELLYISIIQSYIFFFFPQE